MAPRPGHRFLGEVPVLWVAASVLTHPRRLHFPRLPSRSATTPFSILLCSLLFLFSRENAWPPEERPKPPVLKMEVPPAGDRSLAKTPDDSVTVDQKSFTIVPFKP